MILDITNALRAHGIGVGKKLVGNAQPNEVRAGRTFSNADGNDKVGTLPVRATGAQTITPGTANQVLQAGIYDGAVTVLGDADLVSSNIRSGVNLFGIAGNLVEGKRWASGTGIISWNSATSTSDLNVSGLSFQPSKIIITFTYYDGNIYRNYIYLFGFELKTSSVGSRWDNWTTVGVNTSKSAGAATDYWATLTTIKSNGFTYAVDDGPSINYSCNWTAFE